MNWSTNAATTLPQLSVLRVSGQDARSFLQGQLSADLDALEAGRALLASCNSAQGRVQTVLWLVRREDGIALLLPAMLATTIATRLRKYVLRSKVSIESGRLACAALERSALPAGIALHAAGAHVEREGTSYLELPGHACVLLIAPQDEPAPVVAAPAAPGSSGAGADEAQSLPAPDGAQAWLLEDIRAGLPHIHPQTHEAFVAQMLNLDLLGAISFEKGCYTGQEIIARTHYRGTIKRRMYRYAAACPPPPPGTRILTYAPEAQNAAAPEGLQTAPEPGLVQHAGDVVTAASVKGVGEARCELLAVINKVMLERPLMLEGTPDIRLEPLSLPYQID